MQVVDHEQRRLLKGHVGREPVEAVVDRERALCGRVLRSGELRRSEERFHEHGGPREQVSAEIRRGGREQRLEQLTHDPVRELALEFAAAGPGTSTEGPLRWTMPRSVISAPSTEMRFVPG